MKVMKGGTWTVEGFLTVVVWSEFTTILMAMHFRSLKGESSGVAVVVR